MVDRDFDEPFFDTVGSPTVDFATLFGLLGAFALVVTAIVLGGSPTSFFDPASLLIVIGGTFALTTASFSFSEILTAQWLMVKTLTRVRRDPADIAVQLLQLAEFSRRQGMLAVEKLIEEAEDEPFLYRGMLLVIEGAMPEELERAMTQELQAMQGRHARSAGVLRRAAEIAPGMGLIGTLVGLIQMLQHLETPETIGPSMAVALLTTFYGAILANMVFNPLATKLERKSQEESLIHMMFMTAMTSISRQENPRRLEMLLNALLPPTWRVAYFD